MCAPVLRLGLAGLLSLALPLVIPARALAQAPPTSPPQVLTHVEAVYPASHGVSPGATSAHADVTLVVTIDADGHVVRAEVAESAGAHLDEAAIVAVRQWTFKPALRGGKPVASRIRVPFHFVPPAPVPVAAPPSGSEPSTVDGGTPEPPAAPLSGAEGAQGTGVGAAAVDTAEIDPGPPAAPPSAAPAAGAEPTAEPPPETVHVQGHLPPPSRGASDFNFRVGALAAVPRQNAAELLKLAPGILLTNEGGEGHAEQIFLRGFDAREGQDLELSVGAVPINEAGNLHGNGYADTHFLIPELVESLRVVEGPFDPRQGNFAVAGSGTYELGLARRGLTSKVTYGSFGTKRLLLLWGPAAATTHTFGGVELYETAGFGQNRDARRGSAMGQYEGTVGQKGTYRITAQAYSTGYHSAGVLRDDDYRAGRKGFFDTYDFRQGGESSRYSVAGDLETKQGDTVYKQAAFVILRSMRLRENFTGFLTDAQTPLQTLHGQRGDLLDLAVQTTTLGARGSGRFKGRAFDQPQELELGYFARGDFTHGTQHRVETATSVPYLLETDLDAKLGDIGLFGDASLHATSWLALRGGLRADLFTYDVLNGCAQRDVRQPSRERPPGDGSCLTQQDFGRYREPVQRASTSAATVLPRASVLVGPFRDVTFSASYGEGVRSIDPIYISQDYGTPFASIKAYEGGVGLARDVGGVDVSARAVFFQTKVDRDLLFSQTAGRNVLAGGTTRTGGLMAARLTGTWFDEAANVTLVRSTFDDTGLLLPYVPDLVVRSDTSVFSDLPVVVLGERLRGALATGVTYVGRRPLPYGQRSNVVFTIDTNLTVAWKGLEVGLVATNLFDTRYRLGEYNYESTFAPGMPTLVPARHFAAGAPRAFFATLAVTVGP